jgi:hypothetical protein
MSQSKSVLSRRTLFAGAATAGAVAATTSLLPAAVKQDISAPALKTPPANGGGYQLTDHVKRYYKTTLV